MRTSAATSISDPPAFNFQNTDLGNSHPPTTVRADHDLWLSTEQDPFGSHENTTLATYLQNQMRGHSGHSRQSTEQTLRTGKWS